MELLYEYSGLVAVAREDLNNPEPAYFPFTFTSAIDNLLDMDEIEAKAKQIVGQFIQAFENSDRKRIGVYGEAISVSLTSIVEVIY